MHHFNNDDDVFSGERVFASLLPIQSLACGPAGEDRKVTKGYNRYNYCRVFRLISR